MIYQDEISPAPSPAIEQGALSCRTPTTRIITETAQHYGIPASAILGTDRSRCFARPRQIAMYLTRSLTGRSFPEIAATFGRDHTTVMHAVEAVERLRETDASVAGAILSVTERCAVALDRPSPSPVRVIAQIIAGASWGGFSEAERQGFRALARVAA